MFSNLKMQEVFGKTNPDIAVFHENEMFQDEGNALNLTEIGF
jgi:hypothetical protein